MPQQAERITVDDRFAGLPDLGHGGYVAGLIAAALAESPCAAVRLRRPIPTGRGLSLERTSPQLAELRDGETLLAEGTPAALALDVPDPVGLAQAADAASRFPGFERHPYPSCVACGPDHAHGLRIFPGPVPGRRLVAAPWVPDASLADAAGIVAREVAWAALDCPQLWALMVHAPASCTDRVVTSSLTATVAHPVTAGEPHVVIAWPIARDDRSWLAGAAVFAPGGELCIAGRQRAAIAGWGVPLGRTYWHTDDHDHTTTTRSE